MIWGLGAAGVKAGKEAGAGVKDQGGMYGIKKN
jgi:hypothetical protein